MMSHILLEAYCILERSDKKSEDHTSACVSISGQPSFECFFHKCPYLTFASCENAICYIGDASVAEEIIIFGGEMENVENAGDDMCRKQIISDRTKQWKQISQNKINEAYEEYMDKIAKDALE